MQAEMPTQTAELIQQKVSQILPLARIIVFSLLCISCIWIVIDNAFLKTGYSFGMFHTNISSRSVTTTFLLSKPMPACVVWLSVWFPSVSVRCAREESSVHAIETSGLLPNTRYFPIVFAGGHVWIRGINTPRAEEAIQANATLYPWVQTASKNFNQDQIVSVVTIGTVKNEDGEAVPYTPVIAGAVGEEFFTSTWTDSEGKFSLIVRSASSKGDLRFFTWAEGTYAETIVEYDNNIPFVELSTAP